MFDYKFETFLYDKKVKINCFQSISYDGSRDTWKKDLEGYQWQDLNQIHN